MPADPKELLPLGMMATRRWLIAQGVSRHALDNAVKSGVFESLAPGVVSRSGIALSWQGLASSLNRMSATPVYVGGLAALELGGLAHFVKQRQRVTLFAAVAAPTWLQKLEIGVQLGWQKYSTLWPDDLWQQPALLREVSWFDGLPGYLQATPEQAYLEVLLGVQGASSFEHADLLMEGLRTLSPRRLDVLLHHCKSIKVKRLFFFFARRHQHDWYQKLSQEHYDLGSGKRQIIKGGKLNKDLLITVPEHFHG